MKRILNNKRYDTETAEQITEYWNGCGDQDFKYVCESLYKTKNGAYFLAGEGGPMSKYAESIPSGGTSGGSRIEPITEKDAQVWLEANELYDVLEKLFPETVVDA